MNVQLEDTSTLKMVDLLYQRILEPSHLVNHDHRLYKEFFHLEVLFVKICFDEFATFTNEYVDLKHAELVPEAHLHKPLQKHSIC